MFSILSCHCTSFMPNLLIFGSCNCSSLMMVQDWDGPSFVSMCLFVISPSFHEEDECVSMVVL